VSTVVAAVQKRPALFKDLVNGLFDDNPVVRIRAADAMENLVRTGTPAIQSRGKKLLPEL